MTYAGRLNNKRGILDIAKLGSILQVKGFNYLFSPKSSNMTDGRTFLIIKVLRYAYRVYKIKVHTGK